MHCFQSVSGAHTATDNNQFRILWALVPVKGRFLKGFRYFGQSLENIDVVELGQIG